MAEQVEPYDLVLGFPLRWEPNAPHALFLSDDEGRVALAQVAHPDDPDQRCVVLVWDDAIFAEMTPPNDEARHLHRLYDAGLRDVMWVGIVRDSALATQLRPMWAKVGERSATPLHYVVLSKECVIEVLAMNVDCLRIPGAPREAALAIFLS
ncbi:MAG: hypothetical protein QOD05_2522 [Microbacteriaceae bacterium]|nr:hypothetical protein [Microbacteriaceae bacterium]